MNDTGIHDLPALRRTDFAPDFLWGCSTSSYQIEGARRAGRPGRVHLGPLLRHPRQHRRRLQRRRRLRSLPPLARGPRPGARPGLNAYRFSIAWPRVLPAGRGARPNAAGLDFYARLVDGLLERGLEPFATLYHWDLPQALQDQGGWAAARHRRAPSSTTPTSVTRRLGDRVKHWITHNEPWCTAFLGN